MHKWRIGDKMKGNKNTVRLSDTLNWDEDFEPYRIIQIIAGVGSGKNYWVENELMGKPQGTWEEYKRVLLITSRKSKVEETASRTGMIKTLNLSKLEANMLDDSWGELEKNQGCCVCNNWQIEYYVKNKFKHDDPTTHLWNYFDVIVVDEVHSLATDAIFCDAPFHVLNFLKHVYQNSKVKIIMMTATPEPIDHLFSLKNENHLNVLDKKEECRNIQPDYVTYMTQRRAIEIMARLYDSDPTGNWRIIYFSTRTSTIKNKIVKDLTEAGIPESVIAVSFSRQDDSVEFSETIMNNKARTEEYLAKEEDIPEDIKIFITTSRNKEGINIDNKDYKWMLMIESQWSDEILQMIGRLRSEDVPVKYNLIYDAPQHMAINIDKSFDYILETKVKDDINTAFKEWCIQNKIKEKYPSENDKAKQFIKKLEENKLTYLRYDYLSEKFLKYIGRILGIERQYLCRGHYQSFVDSKIYHSYYSDSIDPPVPFKYFIEEEWTLQAYVDKYIESKGYLDAGIYLSESEIEELLKYMTQIGVRKKGDGCRYKNLGDALKPFGYEIVKSKSHNPRSKNYNKKQIRKAEQDITE